ncbi:GNAT family N-acetyltransferase [Nonomuraea typhae]|uniref:GNAT family N-acetyltransferase n=1 Tax=Nonomuraea typhae TaxID=2603600 RepID=UPI0012FB480E|nr:GNAT family N-acetyltransferase [Nonomuraea typhae]
MHVRRLTPADLPRCTALAVSRQWGQEEHKWRFLFDVAEVYGVDAPDGTLASTAMLIPYGPHAAAVSMVLTAADHERKGLAGGILRHILERAGERTVWLYSTAAGRPVYERLGFRAVGRVDSHRGAFTGERSGSTRPATARDLDEIVALDAKVFGADRENLLRRMPAFHERVLVAEEAGRVQGYGGAWNNETHMVIGPVVAERAEQAEALISDLATGWDLPVRLDLDMGRPGLVAWARERGLAQPFENTVMVRGGDLPGDRDRRFLPLMVSLG